MSEKDIQNPQQPAGDANEEAPAQPIGEAADIKNRPQQPESIPPTEEMATEQPVSGDL